MIEQAAQVTRVEADSVWVRVQQGGGCGQCHAAAGCQTHTWARFFLRTPPELQVHSEHAVGVGDQVVLGIAEAGLLKSSLWMYGVPLLAFFIAALFAQAFLNGPFAQAGVIGFALLGLLAGFWWVARISTTFAKSGAYQVRILRTLPQSIGGG